VTANGDATFALSDLVVRAPIGAVRGAALAPSPGMRAVRVFKGLSYAEPPIGALRWRPPQPAAAWSGVRSALEFGHDCPQVGDDVGSRAPGASEDCLSLNIWTPSGAAPGSLPVLVWVHGGSFVFGSGSEARLDGARLAERDVVVVTMNYRLGLFGFLAHPALTRESRNHSSGNYALLDQICALRWIGENIAAFGGDPCRVTVFGVSAGSASIALLLATPHGKGLFKQAILESPGTGRPLLPLAEAQEAGRALGDDITSLRQASAADILRMTPLLAPKVRGLTTPRALRPIRDGWIIPEDERPVFKQRRLNPMPIILGTNADEGSSFVTTWPFKTVAQYRGLLAANFGQLAEAAMELYSARNDPEAQQRVGELFADSQFNYGARLLAQAMAERHGQTWRYLFKRRRPKQTDGPHHGEEVAYVFGNLATSQPAGEDAFDATDRALSGKMMDAWLAFAATGNPNVAGRVAWPPYDAAQDRHLEFGDTLGENRGWRKAQLDFLDAFYDAK
jgi:para-nitrobenzyl esterase